MEEEKTEINKKRRKIPIPCKILIGLLALVGVVLFGARLYFRIPVSDYYSESEKGFKIPGLGDGFIAQGLCADDEYFYVTGYMQDSSASPIYLVDKKTGDLKKTIYMTTQDGEDYNGHCGGISVRDPYVYVAGGKGLYVFTLSSILNVSNEESVSACGYFPVGEKDGDNVGVAYTTIKGNQLIVGEFYREENYPTKDSHKMTTPSGDYNQALALVYNFSDEEDSLYGIETEPVAAYSLPDLVQGMVHHNGKLYLSTSYGAASSHILVYDEAKLMTGTYNFLGKEITLYYCDSSALNCDVKIAPMSEEICFENDKLYVMCESASNKYVFGKFTSAKWCYYTDIEKLEESNKK